MRWWVALAAVSTLTAQNARVLTEEALRDQFEGRKVVLKMDMPGTSQGVDIYMERARELDYRKVGDRNKQHGISLRDGETVTVTKIHLKPKLIEFHLNGGGYGTFGDSMRAPSVPSATVPRSERERDLESRRNRETDADRRKSLDRDLSHERSRRQTEEARLRAVRAQAEIAKRAWEREQRLNSGSRFNLHFEQPYDLESATPQAIEEALARYVSFTRERTVREPAPVESGASRPAGGPALRKGLTEREVSGLFGNALKREARTVEGIEITDAVYRTTDQEIEVDPIFWTAGLSGPTALKMEIGQCRERVRHTRRA